MFPDRTFGYLLFHDKIPSVKHKLIQGSRKTMRLRNIPRAQEVIDQSPFVIQNPEQKKGHWQEKFSHAQPIHLEIGTGKGRFILELSQQHPEINYIGIEKYSSVLFRGVEKQDELRLPNLFFIRGEAELITEYFAKGEVEKIYLNFSDPWPKKRNAKRRLPSREFLQRYDAILDKNGTIEFKTDNIDLFSFALDEIPFSHFELDSVTWDLHHDPIMGKNNIMTEYEERFSAKGNPICKYVLKRKSVEENT